MSEGVAAADEEDKSLVNSSCNLQRGSKEEGTGESKAAKWGYLFILYTNSFDLASVIIFKVCLLLTVCFIVPLMGDMLVNWIPLSTSSHGMDGW